MVQDEVVQYRVRHTPSADLGCATLAECVQ